jgi:CHASE2 domain-containing sensor protein
MNQTPSWPRAKLLAGGLLTGLFGVAVITIACAGFLPANPSTAGFAYLIVVLGVATFAGQVHSTML